MSVAELWGSLLPIGGGPGKHRLCDLVSEIIAAAMLFAGNPSGVSHAPQEHADLADCETGVAALAAVLEELAAR